MWFPHLCTQPRLLRPRLLPQARQEARQELDLRPDGGLILERVFGIILGKKGEA